MPAVGMLQPVGIVVIAHPDVDSPIADRVGSVLGIVHNDSSGDDPFDWPIALGTFTPTSGEGMSALPVLPGVSPSGVTPCVGTACIVPDDGDDYKF